MKHHKTLAGLLIAAAVAVPALSMAQDRDDHHDDRHDDRRQAPAQVDHDHNRGAGPEHAWHKGDRLPDNYRDNKYVVNDWKSRHLRQPPSGYHWVNVNGDYVLAAVATGVIADLLLNQ
jgi:Ni/Co efflux regulator RcnB